MKKQARFLLLVTIVVAGWIGSLFVAYQFGVMRATRFHIVASGDGQPAYRIDMKTGETWRVTAEGLIPVGSAD